MKRNPVFRVVAKICLRRSLCLVFMSNFMVILVPAAGFRPG